MALRQSEPPADGINPVLADRPYQLIRYLGRGSVGEVWAVRNTRMGKHFALKVLHRHLSRDTFYLERFELEAKATASLEHPNVVTVSDYWVAEDGRPCLVMQLLHGVTLARELRVQRRLHASIVIRNTCQVLKALITAHEMGLIHRDIKPENLFLHQVPNVGVEVKLLDFGLARVISADSVSSRFRPKIETRAGVAIGSPRFASPEALRGKLVDHRADIYSLGVVMYLSLVGLGNEFDCATIPSFASPSECGAEGADAALDEIVLRAVQARPEERFQSAREFLDSLLPMHPPVEFSRHFPPREELVKF